MTISRIYNRLKRKVTPFTIIIVVILLVGLLAFSGHINLNLRRSDSYDDDEDGVKKMRQERYVNYMKTQKSRQGPGENGQILVLTNEERQLAESLHDKEGFNVVISDKISLSRAVPDQRSAA